MNWYAFNKVKNIRRILLNKYTDIEAPISVQDEIYTIQTLTKYDISWISYTEK